LEHKFNKNNNELEVCRQNLYEAKKDAVIMWSNHPISPICPQLSHLKRVRKGVQKWIESTKYGHTNITLNFMG